MQRHKATYLLSATEITEIKEKMLNWCNQFSIFIFLDSNNYPSVYSGYDCLIAVDVESAITGNEGDMLSQLQQVHDAKHDWLFGHISYDYKNVLEPGLKSMHAVKVGFPLFYFFIPQTVCYIDRAQTSLTIESFADPDTIYKAILATPNGSQVSLPQLRFTNVVNRADYLQAIGALREHIRDGDCYEINFCNEGYCEDVVVDTLEIFRQLNALSPAPFAAYYRNADRYMMCASPERYLKKEAYKIMSQPIKGTARRDKDQLEDQRIKEILQQDIKERAENVMITDLVRNDLARCSEVGSVVVDELFGIYSFPQVHQMISTVSGTIRSDVPFTDSIRYSFPMGSMTGAPKYKVMQLIDEYERSRRELFSGTVGYITPSGDFDFNVVIRSLFYNAATKYLSYQTGGAITYDSDPEREWEEMQLKAWALGKIFS